MSVTESDLTQPGQGASPPADGLRSRGGGSRRRRWVLGVLALVLAAALVVVGLLAVAYQPIAFGGASGGAFPGVPSATGLRAVNDFGAAPGDLYVPPQRGSFGLTESIQNTGPLPVTIESVAALPPSQAGTAGVPQPGPRGPPRPRAVAAAGAVDPGRDPGPDVLPLRRTERLDQPERLLCPGAVPYLHPLGGHPAGHPADPPRARAER